MNHLILPRVPRQRSRIPAAALSALLTVGLCGCDTHCVGPTCPEEEPESDDDDNDDDPSPGDDDDSNWTTDEWEPEPASQRNCSVQRHHRPPQGTTSVSIAGEFSDWEPQAMEGPATDGSWSIDLGELEAGEYAYKYLYDGTFEGEPPSSAYGKWVDGFENRALRVGDCTLPDLALLSADATSDGSLLVSAQFQRAADGAALEEASIEALFGADETPGTVSVDSDGLITIRAEGLSAGKYSLRLTAADTEGRSPEQGLLFVPLWVEAEPFSWSDGALYFPMTDRFRNGDHDQPSSWAPVEGVDHRANFQGGDYLGILHALDEGYFQSLGVRSLWLSPILDNPEGGWLGIDGTHLYAGYHGYWPTDAGQLNERFGDTESSAGLRLKELVQAAHDQGIRVLLDLVLNHVHEDHSYRALHPEWFGEGCVCGTDGCGWDERPLDCWFTEYLPDMNYRNHPLLVQAVQDVESLYEEYDFDGFRLDAVKHMDTVVVRRLRRQLRSQSDRGAAEALLVGETFTASDGHDTISAYLDPWMLHGQFDFPLHYAAVSAFAQDGSLVDLASAVEASAAAFAGSVMSPFLGNHDVERFATQAAGNSLGPWGYTEDWMAEGGGVVTQPLLVDRLSAAHAFLLSQPGMPLMYYGDEIGLAGAGDPDNRRAMNFAPYLSTNQSTLLGRVQALGQARASSLALRRGARTELWVDDSLYVVAATSEGGEVVVVALHTGWEERSESVPFQDLGLDGVSLTDLIEPTRSVTGADGVLPITLPSWGYALFATAP